MVSTRMPGSLTAPVGAASDRGDEETTMSGIGPTGRRVPGDRPRTALRLIGSARATSSSSRKHRIVATFHVKTMAPDRLGTN